MGQPHVKQTLTNAIRYNQVAHAYLFCGPRGTGKTSAAKVLAKAVNCQAREDADPCNQCEACLSITAGSNVDVEEIDAASNRGVDEIRQLRDKVQYAPTSLSHKVYIIDEVHMLTTEAFNALLKTLEEPPQHAMFVLATTEPHKIPGTIVSRCQRFDFRRIPPESIVERLQLVCRTEQWEADDEALWKIAQAADGGLRDALGLLEQTASYANGNITPASAAHVVGGVDTGALLMLVEALAGGDLPQVMGYITEWYVGGKDAARIVQDLLQVLRDLFIVKLTLERGGTLPPSLAREAYQTTARLCDSAWLVDAVRKLGETYTHLRYVDQPRLALEAALLAMTPVAPAVRDADDAAPMHRAAPPASVQPAAAQPSSAAQPPARPSRAKPVNAARKWEVLRDLSSRADAQTKDQVQAVWDQVLNEVRASRIQTHAWLINGQLMLATADEIVLAFSSPIHRNAVMKPVERALIEGALSNALGRPMRILALTQADWEEFQERQSGSASDQHQNIDLVERVIQVFGPERVEIRDGE
ncbi:DNA polymerase III subunit gamma/tau [Alicyclobacillus cycloheptanicus]|uniref:DNA polymerase III subunit gamma/tau n=1 Tax=Alicyclobacillus cycloheptanicus TaxID=1457 RepID=UPI002378DDCD|nr:DNA polymerase III subunit gamma/tau [Alicyclobacillus cycloheptanicus]